MQTTYLAQRSAFYHTEDKECYGACSFTDEQIDESAIECLRYLIASHNPTCTIAEGSCDCIPMRTELGRLLWKRDFAKLFA